MSENKKDIKQYSASDIQRYLNGQMSPQEMHAMESAALDDPFLADAIEGFETAMAKDAESVSTGLGKLKKEFVTGSANTKVVSMGASRWWQISAAAIILIIAGVAFYTNWKNGEETADSLAVNKQEQNNSQESQKPEEEKRSAATSNADTLITHPKKAFSEGPAVSDRSGSGANQDSNDRLPGESKKPKAASPTQSQRNSKDDLAALNKQESAMEEIADNRSAAPEPSDKRPKDVASISRSNTRTVDRDGIAKQINNFAGRVLDGNNRPIPNASLKVIQNNISLMTNEKGEFNFTTQDSTVDVEVSVVGFAKRNFRLHDNASSNNLTLTPVDGSFDEVVIGNSPGRKKGNTSGAKVQKVVPQDAVPLIGWIGYENYLTKNKKLSAQNSSQGEVVVSFQVRYSASSSDPVLSDFKIEDGLSKEYDAEAIRLIKEGPPWKLLNGRKARITVIVKF